MAKFKVEKKCYYVEVKGSRPTLLYPGEVYESDTLKEKDAPSYFKLIKSEEKKVVAPAPKNDGELSYQEMKSFVIDNEIEVPDQKKETLIKAIEDFKNQSEESEESEEDNSEEEKADDSELNQE